MTDLLFIVVIILFFGVCGLFADLCERI